MSIVSLPRPHLAVVQRESGSLPKYLYRRGRFFYFKRKIPADVVHGFPDCSGQVWKSLGTDLLTRARVLLSVEVAEFDLKVAELRRARARDDAVLLAANTDTLSGEQQTRRLEPPQRPPVEVPHVVAPKAAIPPAPAHRPQATAPKPATPSPPGPRRPSLLHLFEDWKLKQTRPRTIGVVHMTVMEFRTLHGPLAVEDVTKAHARAYRDSLIERGLSKGTVENRLGFLSTLVRHGLKEMVEDLPRNPFEGIDVVGATGLRAPKDRRAYEVSELNTLYASRLYTDDYRPDGQAVDAAYWAPLLGPFLGARIEEVCQLRVEDVQRCWRRPKTEPLLRVVPTEN